MSTSNQLLTATFATSDTIRWNNSELFNGAAWLGLGLPTGYATASLPFVGPKQSIPNYTKIAISAGVIDSSVAVYQNGSLEPPGSLYFLYVVDLQGNRIGPGLGSAVGFSVATSTYYLTMPTLSAPSMAAISAPRPLS